MTNGGKNSERLSGRIEAVPVLRQLSVTLLQHALPSDRTRGLDISYVLVDICACVLPARETMTEQRTSRRSSGCRVDQEYTPWQ